MRRTFSAIIAISVAAIVLLPAIPLLAQTSAGLLEGTAAFGDWHADRPAMRRLIRPQDLPAPDRAKSARNVVRIVHRTDQKPIVPNGFEVNLFASGLSGPRIIRTAPNGDVFVAESDAGRIRVLRGDGGESARSSIFASGLNYPFGIAFYPPGPNPQWVYVAENNCGGALPLSQRRCGGARAARDHRSRLCRRRRPLDARHRLLQRRQAHVRLGRLRLERRQGHAQERHPMGWRPGTRRTRWARRGRRGAPRRRARVRSRRQERPHLRHGLAQLRRARGESAHRRRVVLDQRARRARRRPLPDYITRVREGAFYGWPWYYIGAHEEPRLKGARPDLASKVTVPDVLVQPHAASLR